MFVPHILMQNDNSSFLTVLIVEIPLIRSWFKYNMVDLFGTIHRKKIIFHKNDLDQSEYINTINPVSVGIEKWKDL